MGRPIYCYTRKPAIAKKVEKTPFEANINPPEGGEKVPTPQGGHKKNLKLLRGHFWKRVGKYRLKLDLNGASNMPSRETE